MAGIELAREYYELYGRKMLEESFPALLPYVACGICGSGSECFGYDDEVSRDHDMEPGFCIFLPSENVVDRRTAFLLERAYTKLPKEYGGLRRSLVHPAGGNRKGVLRTAEFFRDRCGSADGVLTAGQWFRTPEQALAEAVNGEIFYDGYGEVSRIRKNLAFFPEDVRLKKLAGELFIMEQAGRYNYPRCIAHGETGAAQLAVIEYAKSAMHVIFLLNRVYMPFYKWRFRALRSLSVLSSAADVLEELLTTDNADPQKKRQMMESVDCAIIEELGKQALSDEAGNEPGAHAYAVNGRIRDGEIRNLHILAALQEE